MVRASLGSHVGKPSSAYGWSGGFLPGSPVSPTFDEQTARYKCSNPGTIFTLNIRTRNSEQTLYINFRRYGT